MELIVQAKRLINVPGGTGLTLCDEAGQMLPNQTMVKLETGIGDAPRLVVEFVIDGDRIRLNESAEK